MPPGFSQQVRLFTLCVLTALVPCAVAGCSKLQVGGAVYHEETIGTYKRMRSAQQCNSLPCYKQESSDVSGQHYLCYAVKFTSGTYGGWAIADRRCVFYEHAKIVADGGDTTRPEQLSSWRERFLIDNGWISNNDVVVTCVDETDATPTIASLTVCLVLLVVFLVMLIITVRRCRQRRKTRRQQMAALRCGLPSVSYRVSTLPEYDPPPSYPSLALGENKAVKDPPPSYQEVVDNPNYIQIHSPLTNSQQAFDNSAFQFDFESDFSTSDFTGQELNGAGDDTERLQGEH